MSRVLKIKSIGQTTQQLESQISWYCKTLNFKLSSIENISEPYLEDLTGARGANVRIATLSLGQEILELWCFENNIETNCKHFSEEAIPSDSKSNDLWFQHICIVVTDLNQAFGMGANQAEQISAAPQTLPSWNQGAANIKAVKFKDQLGHAIEILEFPEDKGDQRWHTSNAPLFMGIDHTAIGISNTKQSREFYQGLLGLKLVGESINYGPEQDNMDGLANTKVLISSLRPEERGMGIEFLDYQQPNPKRRQRLNPQATDLSEWRISMIVEDVVKLHQKLSQTDAANSQGPLVQLPTQPWGGNQGFQVRDPDGHALLLIGD
jgi:catechol 2,3-dioxygenase-like lactoylglutathione lyase family enzyme